MVDIQEIQNMQMKQDVVVDSTPVLNLVRFHISNKFYAVNIKNVREIIENIDYTPYPEKMEHHIGIINVRGVVIPLIQMENENQLHNLELIKIIILEFVEGTLTAIQADKITKCVYKSNLLLPGQTINLSGIPSLYIDEINFDCIIKGNV